MERSGPWDKNKRIKTLPSILGIFSCLFENFKAYKPTPTSLRWQLYFCKELQAPLKKTLNN